MVHNKFPSSITWKNRDRVPTTDTVGLLKIIILSLLHKKIIIAKENKKRSRNEGKNENFLGRLMWENLPTKGDLLRSMLTPRSLFAVGNVRICTNSDYQNLRTGIPLFSKTAWATSLLLTHGGVYQNTSCLCSVECY